MTADCPYRSRRADGDPIKPRATLVAYAGESYQRPDGKTFGAPEVRFTNVDRARAYLDRLDVPGDVSVWLERTYRREFVARRRADGTWILRDFTGRWYAGGRTDAEVLPNAPEFSLWHDEAAERDAVDRDLAAIDAQSGHAISGSDS